MSLPPRTERGPNPFEPPPVASYTGRLSTQQGAPTPPASGEAVAALVCGMLAWACFPLGFLALWLGARARRAVRENPTYVGGDQMALAGMIMGGIFVGVGCLLLLVYVGVFALAIGFHAFR